MNPVEIIVAKRDGGTLTEEQIRWFVDGYARGRVADEQAAALLMALFLNGMSRDELVTWTDAMIASGERLDLTAVSRPTVDKHSTGGVGDKVSLVLAPIVAACGVADPMLSGRGLGHTGGTLDKLESIPGYRVDLSLGEVRSILEQVGCVICAAGERLVPADRRMYALRDVTGTAESIPLIASSIMSKKIAEGAQALVLDVKVGSGAFLPEIDRARELAATMVDLGEAHGVRTSALLTDMDAPLGRAVGNALEVAEALECLRDRGPDDLMEVVHVLAAEMLALAGVESDPRHAVSTGAALERWEAMVSAQGGDPGAELPEARHRRSFDAPGDGYLRRLDARAVGVAAWRLGAGRARKEDPVSPTAGVVCLRKPGDRVTRGEPILELHADDESRFAPALEALAETVAIGDEVPPHRTLVIERIRR